MKYIKLFENYENDLYYELSHRSFLDSLGSLESTIEKISEKEIKVIESYLPNIPNCIKNKQWNYIEYHINGFRKRKTTTGLFDKYLLSPKDYHIKIYKDNDEWFFINFIDDKSRNYYYKSEIEGIKNIINKHI